MFNTALCKAAEKAIQNAPGRRVLPLRYGGISYVIKRKCANGRNMLIKPDTDTAFYYEAYTIMKVNQYLPLAPHIVCLQDDYFVMENAGRPLQEVAKDDAWRTVRSQAFYTTGQNLGYLHNAGLHHGRPALRDIAYDRDSGKITFLDWENKRSFLHADRQVLDVFLFIHSCFREEWETTELIDAAMNGYRSLSQSNRRLEGVKAFVRHHTAAFTLCRDLSFFHWIDVQAVAWACQYIEELLG